MNKQEIKEHPCPVCGKMTTNKTVCSRECHYKAMSTKSTTGTQKIALSNQNICAQCKRPMPINRYSMYCEECELHIEE